MHYYVDGYNFLFRICQKGDPLEKRRDRLIDLLNEELGFLKGRCSLVFDSSEQIRDCPQCAFLENLEVIFTPRGLNADKYILEMVEYSSNPKALTVVTSDNDLGRQCRHLGSLVMTIEAFIAFILKKTRKKGESKPTQVNTKAEIERLRRIFEDGLDGN